MSSTKLTLVGMDPSLRNWGLAKGSYDLATGRLTDMALGVVQATELAGKQVRQNSKDIHVATQLFHHAMDFAAGADALFVEVPVGSQSARAMASYGICVGILGAMRTQGMPFFEVTPTEVKLAGAGHKLATKQDMIQWAMLQYPNANWPTYGRGGETLVSEARAEHMADAIAAIHAGLALPAFQQLLSLLNRKEAA